MNGTANFTPGARKGNGKGGKFNFIDFLLIIVILLIIAAIVYVFLPSSWVKSITADKSSEIQYTIEFQAIDEDLLNNISEKDIILDSVSKSNIGTVTAVDYSMPYTELTYDEDGNGELAVFPAKYNVIVTISATADYTEGEGYSVGGTRIAVGEKIAARFPNFIGEGYCISFSVD